MCIFNINLAFYSIEHIFRNVNNGWLLRYCHANGASMFFIIVYIHIARGLYFKSYLYPRILLWYSGILIFVLMMATAFMGARVRRVVRFWLSKTHWVALPYNLLSESLSRKCMVTFRYLNINSFGFKGTASGGMKRFNPTFKISINYLIALIGVVSILKRASTFLSRSSLISKRLRIHSVANNYNKLVHAMYLTTSTYTFNYYHLFNDNVKGEIRKKT